jgi:hypothetical protein
VQQRAPRSSSSREGPQVVKHMRPRPSDERERGLGTRCSSCLATDAASQPKARAKAPNELSSD